MRLHTLALCNEICESFSSFRSYQSWKTPWNASRCAPHSKAESNLISPEERIRYYVLAAASPPAASAAFSFLLFFTTSRTTRTLGKPNGLRPSTHFSCSFNF